MPTESEDMSTTELPNLNGAERKYSLDSGGSNGTSKSVMSNDYIQRARVTRPAPPKPSCNPMQFVQIKPCNLYQSAQEQLKRAEEVKKVKEIKKEEPEDWQSNLDNWKSSRRKRVEHIIDRVVEVKKLELEEHDRTRRKSKTFSEMLEDRGTRRKLSSLAVYTEDDSNDLSDLGIGTSSVSGKSSLSEDCDNQSVISDKASFELLDNNANEENGCKSRDYISSPGYDTAPTSSPDPCEYTYEGAIQDYKTRISRAQSNGFNNGVRTISAASKEPFSKDSTPEFSAETNVTLTSRRMSGTKIEERLLNFEIKSSNGDNFNETNPKNDLPKVDIIKRKELFEKDSGRTTEITNGQKPINKSIKDRLSNLDRKAEGQRNNNQFSSDIFTIKDRLQNLEKHGPVEEKLSKIDVPVVPLKDRLSSLQNAVNKEEVKKPVQLVDEHQLEILRNQDLAQQKACNLEMTAEEENLNITEEIINAQDESALDTDREDSGIHTTDVSCSVSQTDEQPELVNYEHHHINIDRLCQTDRNRNLDDGKSVKSILAPDLVPTKTISPSTLTEQTISLEVDIIAEDESPAPALQEPQIDLDSSVNEALELALQAIDSEPKEKPVQISNISKNLTTSLIIDGEIQQINSQQCIYENGNKVINNYEDLSNFGVAMPSETCAITETIKKVNIQPQLEKQQEKMPIRIEQTVLVEQKLENDEPYYQVPKSSEPYYEVPKFLKPIAPVYENIEILYTSGHENGLEGYQISNESLVIMEPPKEKPPPPPIEKPPPPPIEKLVDGEMSEIENHYKPSMAPAPKPRQHQPQSAAVENGKPMKRVNSTKRIKKELRNKRSSFLGIEGSADDDILLELTPPPDMAQLLQEERRLDKKLKAGLYDNSDPGDGRHTGVSANHSRQCSDHFTNSSEEHGDRNNSLANKEREIIEILENEGKKHRKSSVSTNWTPNDVDQKMRSIEGQIREQEEVLRVERELLQLEQEELKRQRENLLIRENLARRELEHGAKMLMSANRRSLQNINASVSHYANIPNQIYQIDTDYRKSMSDLNDVKQRPAPPAKPSRTHLTPLTKSNEISLNQGSLVKIANHNSISPSQPMRELVSLRNYQHPPNSKIHHGNMTRHTLHTLSATPKPKFTDDWVHSINPADKAITNDSWPTYQQKRKSVPEGFNYNKHWLIQEAEQRRIDQQRGVRGSSTASSWATGTSAIISNDGSANKPLPDSIIQTLTQRVQSKGIGDRKRLEVTPTESVILPSFNSPSKPLVIPSPIDTAVPNGQQEKILSVSGKKKCSHCGEELGRGAAMIIESLRLFYHIDCFKCCVCHVQLGDGLNGTDVRVRNQKLHCHNCYSSDDGIKFSCV